ncbi:ATP-binding protein [Streptomyces sp. ISL-11]|uniref:ATP-binding protein n=1 Tax=Streptomyces sp. ISL-11 TaxID=2819174 RepID=UPI001BE8D22B|nr:ATP-binding protein [Streptomyces sp. ISL-11]MBT2384245.1 ATP-binding protein [Streptomyces sp. ISL-11]
MPHLLDPVQLCAAELVTYVISHVGAKTPTWVTMSLDGPYIRIEVRDPDPRRFPAQGPRLIEAVVDRWGVVSHDYGKTTWCELATGLPAKERPPTNPRLAGIEALLTLYGRVAASSGAGSPLSRVASEEAATELIADLLHWLRAHGADPDTALDRAQTRYEAVLAQFA